MKGFFEEEELQSDSIRKGRILSCVSCKLHRYADSPKVEPIGKFKKKVMIIGESPQSNRLLKEVLNKLNFNLSKDAIMYNAVNCDTEIEPSSLQVECCRNRVQGVIGKYKPKVIILLGKCAIESIIGKYWKKSLGGVTRWRGWKIPDQNYKAWICPTFDPEYISKQKKDDVSKLIWFNDLKGALKLINKKVPVQPNFSDYIEFCHTNDQVRKAIKQIKKTKLFATDVESTGLRPYRKGQKLICTSVAISTTKCFVWENNKLRNKWFRPILKTNKIKKIAHNLQMEDTWFSYFMKTEIKGWLWCTMNNAHILDNRKGISGLKFQVYVNFGVASYDEDVEPYLKGKQEKVYGANSINTIHLFIKKYGMERLFEYCGMDSIFCLMLAFKQMRKFKYDSSNYRL